MFTTGSYLGCKVTWFSRIYFFLFGDFVTSGFADETNQPLAEISSVVSREETIIYVAELTVELEKLARDADLKMISYLLSMAAREASHEIFDRGLFTTTTRQ